MDHNMKAHLCSLLTSSPPLHDACLQDEGWHCMLNSVKITSDHAKAVRKAVFGTRLQKHLHEHNLLSLEAFHDMDWDAIESASKHFPPHYCFWMSKHVSGFMVYSTASSMCSQHRRWINPSRHLARGLLSQWQLLKIILGGCSSWRARSPSTDEQSKQIITI